MSAKVLGEARGKFVASAVPLRFMLTDANHEQTIELERTRHGLDPDRILASIAGGSRRTDASQRTYSWFRWTVRPARASSSPRCACS
jgi:hypothetical protein